MINTLQKQASLKKGIALLFLIISSVASTTPSFGQKKVMPNVSIEDFTESELKEYLTQYNFYDFVRSVNKNEELVNRLILSCEKYNYMHGLAQCKNLLGVIKRDKAEYPQAIKLHEEALELSKFDTTLQIISLNNLGVVYRRMDKPRIAIDYHSKALKLSEDFNSDVPEKEKSIGIALNSIGNINLVLKQPRKAIDFFERSLKKERENKNYLGIAINLHNIGYAYELMKDTLKALNYYEESLYNNKLIDSEVGKAICLSSIGNIYLMKNEFDKAEDFVFKSMKHAKNTNDNYYIAQAHALKGRFFLSKQQYDLSYNELLTYNKIARTINSGFLIQDSYSLLSDYYKEQGDFSEALKYYKTAREYNDSILNEKNSRYLNELQTLYEADKQQQQIDLLLVENKIKNQRFIFLVLTTTLFLFTLVTFFYLQQKRNSLKKSELEQKLFRSQMNPHFIFNALGSIQNYMYKNDPKSAARYLGYFSSLSRNVLLNSSKELITLEAEIETLASYLKLEQLRKMGAFDYTINVDDEIEPDFTLIPPMMLQPMIENAVKHAFTEDISKPKIELMFEQQTDFLKISITDNGIGINHSLKLKNSSNHESMSIKIFNQRRKLLQKRFKKPVIFNIDDLNELNKQLTGTRIEVQIPIIYKS